MTFFQTRPHAATLGLSERVVRPSQSHYCYYYLVKNHSRVRPDNAASKIQPAPASSRLNYETNGLILWKEIEMLKRLQWLTGQLGVVYVMVTRL